jgi:hypothetical protein
VFVDLAPPALSLALPPVPSPVPPVPSPWSVVTPPQAFAATVTVTTNGIRSPSNRDRFLAIPSDPARGMPPTFTAFLARFVASSA